MLRQITFGVILIYTWALTSFVDRIDAGTPLLYAATVAPAVLFILMAGPFSVRTVYPKADIALLAFALLTGICALYRRDFSQLASLGSLCVMLVVIRHSKVAVGLTLVNTLFVLSIMACMVMTALGSSRYGIFPGQTDDPISWRVSLFPYNVTPSWMFALIVIGLNYFHNRQPIGKIILVSAGLYFLIFSASRTGLIILLMCITFVACTHLVRFRMRLFYKLLVPFFVLLFIVTLSADLILSVLADNDNPILNAALFKSTAGVGNAQQAATSIERTLLWAAHAQIFMDNPWIGHGSFDLEDLVPFTETHSITGSESFTTGLFARTGLLALLFIYFMYLLCREASGRQDRLGYCLGIFFAISSIAYGSYIVPYDFVFLALFGTINYSRQSALPCA